MQLRAEAHDAGKAKRVGWAFYIETIHLHEHIGLTAITCFIGKPIGTSTRFGKVGAIGDREFAVGCPGHLAFRMNLLPMPFAMIELMDQRRDLSVIDRPLPCGQCGLDCLQN